MSSVMTPICRGRTSSSTGVPSAHRAKAQLQLVARHSDLRIPVAIHIPPESSPSYPTSAQRIAAMLEAPRVPVIRTELRQMGRMRDRERSVDNRLRPLLEAGLIQLTIPDKPRSSKQEYRLTEKGRQVLAEIKGIASSGRQEGNAGWD